MNLGKHIRANRLRLNLTQERLAEKLNVTAQAVSKWESGSGMPDIALLPEISAVFGISIDELFETSEELHLNRIEAMVDVVRGYGSYSGIDEGMVGRTQFIIKSAGI